MSPQSHVASVRQVPDSESFYDIMWEVGHHWDKAKRVGLGQLSKTLKTLTVVNSFR